MRLTESQRQTIINALHVAALQYFADADSLSTVPGHTRMAEQFRKQYDDARALADVIEQAETVEG